MSFRHLHYHSNQQWSLQDALAKQQLLEIEKVKRKKYAYDYRPKPKNHGLLILGFLRISIQNVYNVIIPFDIKNLIMSYYPNYMIYSSGRNDRYGALGLNHKNKIYSFTQLTDLSLLCCNVNSMYLNASRILIKDLYDEIYGAGSNKYDELAVLNEENVIKFCKIECVGNKVKFVSSGTDNFYHTFFCTNNDELYVCGCNYRGQFGNGLKSGQSFKTMPIKIDNNFITQNGRDSVFDIQCGCRHTAFLSRNGYLYCVGSNQYGQIGQESNILQLLIPQRIDHEYKIKSLKVGRFRTLFIDEKQKVYGFGWNDRGQLGFDYNNSDHHHDMNASTVDADHNSHNESIWSVTMIEYFRNMNIVRVECGSGHTFCLDDHGNLYCFGWNKYGQCGQQNYDNNQDDDDGINKRKRLCIFKPFKVILGDTSNCVVDMNGGFAHSAVLNDKNKLYTFGYNIYKQCSVNNPMKKIYFPYYVSKTKEILIQETDFIEKVVTLPDSTLIVVNCNKLR